MSKIVSDCCNAPVITKENRMWEGRCIGSRLVTVGTYYVCTKCNFACDTEYKAFTKCVNCGFQPNSDEWNQCPACGKHR